MCGYGIRAMTSVMPAIRAMTDRGFPRWRYECPNSWFAVRGENRIWVELESRVGCG